MRVALALIVVACGGAPARPEAPKPVSTELSPDLAPLAWWLGDWDGDHDSEHWIAAAGAIYGIALSDRDYEVMIVDDADGPGKPDGILRFIAMPGGAKSVEFRKREATASAITFANDAHDYPKTIAYRGTAGGLAATIAGNGKSEQFAFRRGQSRRAPELEAADVAFSQATVASGVDGWVAAFDDHGAMLRKSGRIEGKAAIGDAMRALLASGTLAWAPIASGRRGALGFTVGKATFTGAKPEDGWRSTYVTIWREQPDHTWKVWFDGGRVVNE